ncbi:MAG: hypothetical protein EOO38_21720 [Cytophagaceae bacterium]|nr:MAG: hypothetical protein EOO38_21720 [Cytophagaceae bacterium]
MDEEAGEEDVTDFEGFSDSHFEGFGDWQENPDEVTDFAGFSSPAGPAEAAYVGKGKGRAD